MNEERRSPRDSSSAIRNFINKTSDADADEFRSEIPLPPGPFPFVIAIVPAYNEQESILRTLTSLSEQTKRPDEIIVLADNCTDDTIPIALAAGVSVVETDGNADGKAGALNSLLGQILPFWTPKIAFWSWMQTRSCHHSSWSQQQERSTASPENR